MINGEINLEKKYKNLINDFEIPNIAEDILLYKGLIYVPKAMRVKIIEMYHDDIVSGHFGIIKTKELISRNFIWLKMTEDITNYVKSCRVCCQAKDDRHKPYGLLMPLPTPTRPWSSISIDFITELPKSKDKTVVMVVVDRLTKMSHFIPFRMIPTAEIAANVFFREIFRLHGLPDEIISDRGTQFTSEFWQRLCTLLGIRHNLSSAHHPQTDGQTERVNGILEQYLRCYTNKKQDNWVDLLPYAEFAYNNSVHQSIKQTPFYANYGQHPKTNPFISSLREDLDTTRRAKLLQKNIIFLINQLDIAKERYKKYADFRRQEGPPLKENDLVWLKRPDLIEGKTTKLSQKKIGPFKIISKLSPVSYKIELPPPFKCHNVFHICELEPFTGRKFDVQIRSVPLPDLTTDSEPMMVIQDAIVHGNHYYCVLYNNRNTNKYVWLSEKDIEDPQLIQEYLKAKKN
eukprot:jgi/Orpsp1_1/1178630/evm.model.c7180000066157.1